LLVVSRLAINLTMQSPNHDKHGTIIDVGHSTTLCCTETATLKWTRHKYMA